MFDAILQSLTARFGLNNDTARKLLGMLVGLVFNEKSGGPAGFAELFRQKGLGHLIESWTGSGENQPISGDQLEQVLGSEVVGSMAGKLGLDAATVKNAAAGALPGVFDALTADGRIPSGSSIPDTLLGHLGDAGEWLKGLGGWGLGALGAGAGALGAAGAAGAAALGKAGDAAAGAASDAARAAGRVGGAAADAAGGAARAAGQMAGDAADAGAGLFKRLLPWLLIGAVLVGGFLALRSCNNSAEEAPAADAAMPATTAPPAPAPETQPAPPAPAPQASTGFSMENGADGKVNVSGQVPSDTDKTKLMSALTTAFGAGNVNGDLTVDASALPTGWMDKLIAALPDLKASGLKLGFNGDKVTIDSSAMPEDQRFAVSDKLRTAFGGMQIDGLWDKGTAALSGLKSGFSADDLTQALNLMNIYFDTGSAHITADSEGTLAKAAEAIKAAPAGTRLEVGGHTDNKGNANANQTLSQQRADAVKAKLGELGVDPSTLSAKGYGQTKPVADNGTTEGRAKNRRIEFTVMK